MFRAGALSEQQISLDDFEDWFSDYIGSEVNNWIDDSGMQHHSQHEIDTWSEDELAQSYNDRGCHVEFSIKGTLESWLSEMNLLE